MAQLEGIAYDDILIFMFNRYYTLNNHGLRDF